MATGTRTHTVHSATSMRCDAVHTQVCQNAMKQYRRTRPDPSGRAIMRAKLLDRGETHPLLVKFEARGMHSAAAHAGRNEFMRAMSR